jgi:hypothetical protein
MPSKVAVLNYGSSKPPLSKTLKEDPHGTSLTSSIVIPCPSKLNIFYPFLANTIVSKV